MSQAILSVVDLGKSFGETRALDGVSLNVPAGEIFGLLGPNGAGKTTFLSIIAGLLEPGGGRILLDGQPLSKTRDQKRLIGIVPQELAIYGELSARENLRFFGRLYGLNGAELETRVDDVLQAVGLVDRADERAATYSGGMKRRLNLGAGLVHGPRLLLLDEPTAGVDPQSRRHIFEEVQRRNAQGTTLIYTSHYMEEVQELCTRVGIIDHGKLIACAPLRELLSSLPGMIRMKTTEAAPAFLASLTRLGAVHRPDSDGKVMELECADVKSALPSLLSLLTEEKTELSSLEIEEPNLERVFLHLTGRGLRD